LRTLLDDDTPPEVAADECRPDCSGLARKAIARHGLSFARSGRGESV
jgi:hypothetical protein